MALKQEDWVDLLKGNRKGGVFEKGYFLVKQKKDKKITQEAVLTTNGQVGLPSNLNENYSVVETKRPAKKRKIDPAILKYLNKK